MNEEAMIKFLVVVAYYERPEMLRNALRSVKNSTYKNWDLCLIDDGIEFPGIGILNECFTKEERIEHGISYIQTMDEKKRKDDRGGSQHGIYINTAIETSDSDIIIILCDDDILMSDYMEKLNSFYTLNPEVKYSYCHLEFYDPLNEKDIVNSNYTRYLNSMNTPINPVRRVDSSQVTWRRNAWIESGIKFPYPRTSNLDELIFGNMHNSWGKCVFNDIVGQRKGIHAQQLINFNKK
jgi:glycosyltransferase involved in cell wall biosynthesis